MLDFGVCGLLQGVGFGLRGEPQGAAHVGRGAGLGAFPGEDPGFQLAAVHAVQDGGFVAYLHGSKYCITHGFEFGVAAVRLKADGLVGAGDPGGFPVGGGQARATGVFLTQRGGRARGQHAELPGQPRLRAGGHLFPEGPGPVIERGRQLVRDRRGAGGCALRPGHVVPGQKREGESPQAAVQDAGDGSGAVHWHGSDLVDEGADVVPGELGGAEVLLQGFTGVLVLVTHNPKRRHSFHDPFHALIVGVRIMLSSWEPPIGIEPMTYALRVRRSNRLS